MDFREIPQERESEELGSGADGLARVWKPDEMVSGRYRIISQLGKGGMGRVYRVEQVFLGKDFALKVLDAKNVKHSTLVRFQREAKAAAKLVHDNLVQVHDFGTIDDAVPFLVMDFVSGSHTLEDQISESGPLPVDDTIEIFIQVCNGLAHAHQHGVIHRDVKPSNILLESHNGELRARVVDFGIAKIDNEETVSQPGEVLGSPLYMSPEQCNSKPLDKRTDIYSLGCTLYQALTGVAPFQGSTAMQTIVMHQSAEPPPFKEAAQRLEINPAYEQIVAKMLAKSPDERFQTMDEVASALAKARAGGGFSNAEANEIAKPDEQLDSGIRKRRSSNETAPITTGKRRGSLAIQLVVFVAVTIILFFLVAKLVIAR